MSSSMDSTGLRRPGDWACRPCERCVSSGVQKDVFVESIGRNVRHGLPVTLADRRRAAGRRLRSHSDWSDRKLLRCAGYPTKRSVRCGERPTALTRLAASQPPWSSGLAEMVGLDPAG